MKLTEEDKALVVDWLQQRCGQMRCFCCGNALWQLLDGAAIQIGFDVRTTRFHYHEGIPVVSVVCENCGHLINFAANLIGLKSEQVQDAAAKAAARDA